MTDQSEVEIGPDFRRAPELDAAAPPGRLTAFVLNSWESAFYPGVRRLDNDVTRRRDAWGNRLAASAEEQSAASPYRRTVWVYSPAKPVEDPLPVIIAQDGHAYADILPRVLDVLIDQGRAPAMAAVLIDSGGGDAQGSQRGLEYDTVSGLYSDFVEAEVLSRAEREIGAKFSLDPDRRAVMGVSSGAACAFTMAWFHPDRYRRVLSYSGTFVNQASPVDPATPRGAWEYHARLIPEAERKPLRVWLEVGALDLHHDDPEESWHNWPLANQRMAAALADKGYDYRFTFSRGGRHADRRVLEHTLPGALDWLWAGDTG